MIADLSTHPTVNVKSSAKHRIEGMDAVRTLAIALVLLAHNTGSPRFPFPSWNHSFLHLGTFGVLLFFVLSGFLQTRLLLSDERKFGEISIKLFYYKRLLRIVPTMVVYLTFLGFWCAFTNYHGSVISFAATIFCLRQVIAGDPLTAHFWSLSLEIIFYLIWPLMLKSCDQRFRGRLAISAVVALPLVSVLINTIIPDTPRVFWSAIFRADPIFIGCWLGLSNPQTHWLRKTISFGSSFAFGAVVIALALALEVDHLMLRYSSYFMIKVGEMAETFLAAWIVNAALQIVDGPAYRLVSFRVVKYVALVSFGIYVWQQFFFFGNPNDWLFSWPPKSLYFPLFWFPLNLIAGCTVGVLSYLLIECPLAPWRDQIIARIASDMTLRASVAPHRPNDSPVGVSQ